MVLPGCADCGPGGDEFCWHSAAVLERVFHVDRRQYAIACVERDPVSVQHALDIAFNHVVHDLGVRVGVVGDDRPRSQRVQTRRDLGRAGVRTADTASDYAGR
jgi:hypothetical protein